MASAALDGVASQQTDRFAVWLVLNNETQVWLRCTCVSFLMLRCGTAPDFLLFGGSYRDIFRAVPHRHRAFDGCLRRVDLQGPLDRKSTRLNSSHKVQSRMPSAA